MSGKRIRADKLLVAHGHFESRAAAQAAIEAGKVYANGARIMKASQNLSEDADISAQPAHPYVSRGGLKLAAALKAFDVSVEGRTCLDLGASTGGFTDVLLQAGALNVTCIDIGKDQLHPRLRADPRVSVFESTDIRSVSAGHIRSNPDILVTDLSFISLEKALGPALGLISGPADLIGLFKPQFQVGRAHIGKGGIVTDERATQAAIERFQDWMKAQDWPVLAWTDSPITGGDGNREHLFHAQKDN